MKLSPAKKNWRNGEITLLNFDLIYSKEWIMNNLEQDWDNDNIYYEITEKGVIKKFDIVNNILIEYQIEVSATH